MITYSITSNPKSTPALEFARLNEKEIIPLLRKQKGLREEIPLVAPKCSEPKVSSLWKDHYYVSSR